MHSSLQIEGNLNKTKSSFLQYYCPLSLVVTTNRQLIVINNKIRQYEKIVLCDQLMLNYCRTDIHKCFLER